MDNINGLHKQITINCPSCHCFRNFLLNLNPTTGFYENKSGGQTCSNCGTNFIVFLNREETKDINNIARTLKV